MIRKIHRGFVQRQRPRLTDPGSLPASGAQPTRLIRLTNDAPPSFLNERYEEAWNSHNCVSPFCSRARSGVLPSLPIVDFFQELVFQKWIRLKTLTAQPADGSVALTSQLLEGRSRRWSRRSTERNTVSAQLTPYWNPAGIGSECLLREAAKLLLCIGSPAMYGVTQAYYFFPSRFRAEVQNWKTKLVLRFISFFCCLVIFEGSKLCTQLELFRSTWLYKDIDGKMKNVKVPQYATW